MKKIYESLYEIYQARKFLGLSQYDFPEEESQFLNFKPKQEPLIGIIPMTGKGIDDEVDDLSFLNDDYEEQNEERKLIYK